MYQPRQIEKSGGQTIRGKGMFRSTYDALTAEENAGMVKSIAAFAVGTAFLASSWAEFLLPPVYQYRNSNGRAAIYRIPQFRAAWPPRFQPTPRPTTTML